VPARRADPCGEVDVRCHQCRQPRAARRIAFGLFVEIVHRRHPGGDIGGGDLRRRVGLARRGPVGVEVEQAG
jgi:hypothetical protein